MSSENKANQALDYAAQGLRVFPVHWLRDNGHCSCGKSDCHSPGKHPLTKDGCLSATVDEQQITKWWTANPEANIGIATGKGPGLFVVDLEADGIEPFEHIFDHLEVPTVATGGGGRHLYFAYPVDRDLNNGTRLHGIAVDVRGAGGYVLAPPSNHLSGTQYTWLQQIDGSLPEIPQLLLEWILSAKSSSKPLTFVGDLDECPGVSEGQRNSTLAEYVGRHLAYGEPVTMIIDKAIAWGQRCSPPLTEHEVYQTVRSIEQKHRAEEEPDDEPDDDDADEKPTKKSQAAKLVELCEGVELFHDEDGTGYASFESEGHRETRPIRGKAFRMWMCQRYWNLFSSTPSAQAIQDAINVLEGFALFAGGMEPVFVRVAPGDADRSQSDTTTPSSVTDLARKLPCGDAGDTGDADLQTNSIVIDLGTPEWKVVVVTPHGWEIVDASPVRFRRPKGFQALPIPRRGGSLNLLKGLLNVTAEDWPLVAGWLLGAFCPTGPYPIMTLYGEAGTAKSSTARTLRLFVDPNQSPLRREPRNEHDLVISAHNSWIVAFDNLSHVPTWLSDGLCRLATGGGFSTRTLYENCEETIFNVQRPAIINGIESLATRGDLVDRLVPITLERIDDADRIPEREYWAQVDQYAGLIFGGLLDAVSQALRNLPNTTLETLPRMADFALWVAAGETALGLQSGEFMQAYSRAYQSANESVLESSLVATAILKLLEKERHWTGTATELIYATEQYLSEADQRSKRWPKDGTRMSGQLRRVAPNLRKSGIQVDFQDRSNRRRKIVLYLENDCKTVSPASLTAENGMNIHVSGNAAGDAGDARGGGGDATSSAASPMPDQSRDAGDTNDAEKQTHSNGFKFVC